MSVQQVELTTCIQAALVVFVQTFVGVLDTCEVRDASVYRLQEVQHGEVSSIESGDMVVVEGQLRGASSDLFTVLDQLFDSTDLGEGRSHRSDTKGTDLLSVSSQTLA